MLEYEGIYVYIESHVITRPSPIVLVVHRVEQLMATTAVYVFLLAIFTAVSQGNTLLYIIIEKTTPTSP